ncbi:SRPBCC family protein [Noviherbaspirillum sp. L7-7A]|uniref:SRPBCC family protein n=1 Tax=Noviherbaspirillum sp. L7-7A TaxID=2850560 RepID=UPI001C2C4C5D|nr:SRPBCC family protein [Noviherbaspirillum sp. L7-7A]MBV0881754.1 SRPBCC family protein [Noviherbaspirillum sp. L7-7A]
MARIQQSVDISVPARVAYNQLTQFEDYPRFMQEVESAQQVDDTHVRWTTRVGQQKRDWNSEIIEQQPDQCIAWRNLDGPINTGRVDVEALGENGARVTFTLEADGAHSGTEGDHAMAKQVQEDLQRLKQMMEGQGHETGAWRGEVHGGQVTGGESGAAAGPAGSGSLSENALSKEMDRNNADGRFNVAEEVNLDQQSDAVRHAGNLPHQSTEGYGDMGTNEAMKNALQGEGTPAADKEKLDDSIKRAVPPSN